MLQVITKYCHDPVISSKYFPAQYTVIGRPLLLLVFVISPHFCNNNNNNDNNNDDDEDDDDDDDDDNDSGGSILEGMVTISYSL